MKNLFITLLALVAILAIVIALIKIPPNVIPEKSALIPVETEEEIPTEVTPGSKTEIISLDQRISYNNIMIEASVVTEDSRCPSDVQCIQAGRATVIFNIYSLEGEHIQSKEVDERGMFYAGSTRITLQEVTPHTLSTHKIGDDEYRFKLLLEVVE